MQQPSHCENTRLSVVVAGRNDDYAEGFLHRYHCFLSHLAQQVGQFSASVEIVVVDWNPPEDKHRLCAELGFLNPLPNLSFKFIEVPFSIHRSLENSNHIPLFEYRAKNVGVRRASGEFVLATNPDVLFTHELMQFICEAPLRKDVYYRVERHNFSERIHTSNSPAKNLELARKSVTFSSLFKPRDGERQDIVESEILYGHAGDFWLAHRSVWSDLSGYREFTTSGHMDSIICLEAMERGTKQYVLPSEMRVYHQNHPDSRSKRPGTNLHYWREWCERDDHETDRSRWGLAGVPLPVQTGNPPWQQNETRTAGWTIPVVTPDQDHEQLNPATSTRIPVSLGGGCEVATEFLRPHGLSGEAHFFDYLWNLEGGLRNVTAILESHFAGFDLEDNYVYLHHPGRNTPESESRLSIACGSPDAMHLCHRTYRDISFAHYHSEEQITQKIRHKAQRFMRLLNGDYPLTFIYCRQYHSPLHGNDSNEADNDIEAKLELFRGETEDFVGMMRRQYPEVDFRLVSCFAGPGAELDGISDRIATFIENLPDNEHTFWRQVIRRGHPAAAASWSELLKDI